VDWFPWGAVTRHATLEAGAKRLPPCALRAFDAESLTVEWEAPPCKPQAGEPPSAYLYELQVRDSTCDAGWTTVSTSLKGTVAKKKNLSQAGRYSFRVRPSLQDESQPGEKWSFSAPNATDFRPRSPVAPIFNDLFGPKLVDAKGMAEGMAEGKAEGGSYPVDSKLAGCVVALYFSASWCGPCRQFTPQLAQFYARARAAGRRFEVVFVSADRDEASFKEYLGHMPWLAVPFDRRQTAQMRFQVNGIPNLKILGPSGALLDDNAVQSGSLTVENLEVWERGGTAPPPAHDHGHSHGHGCCGGGHC